MAAFIWRYFIFHTILLVLTSVTQVWAVPQVVSAFTNGTTASTSTSPATASIVTLPVGYCECAVYQDIIRPLPGWRAAPTSTPVATVVVTINNSTNVTSSSFLPQDRLLATNIGNGVSVATVTVTLTTEISPSFKSTVFETVITSPATFEYTNYYLDVISAPVIFDSIIGIACDGNREDRGTFTIPWTPPLSTTRDPSPYTIQYPPLTACTGFKADAGFSVIGSDLGGQIQGALTGGVTVTQLSYIFDDEPPVAVGDEIPPPVAPAGGGDPQITSSSAPVLRSSTSSARPPSSPVALEPIQTPPAQQPEVTSPSSTPIPQGSVPILSSQLPESNQPPSIPEASPTPTQAQQPSEGVTEPQQEPNPLTSSLSTVTEQALQSTEAAILLTLPTQTLTLSPGVGSSLLLSGSPVAISVSTLLNPDGSQASVISNLVIGSSTIPLPLSSSPTPIIESKPPEIITLPGGPTLTANPEGNFVLSGSTLIPSSGSVEIVGSGSSTEILGVATQTAGVGNGTESGSVEFTGGAVSCRGFLWGKWLWGIVWGLLLAWLVG